VNLSASVTLASYVRGLYWKNFILFLCLYNPRDELSELLPSFRWVNPPFFCAQDPWTTDDPKAIATNQA